MEIREYLEKNRDIKKISQVVDLLDLGNYEYQIKEGEKFSFIEVYECYIFTFLEGELDDMIAL